MNFFSFVTLKSNQDLTAVSLSFRILRFSSIELCGPILSRFLSFSKFDDFIQPIYLLLVLNYYFILSYLKFVCKKLI